MNSFKEKFKIAKILASLFTHSSTPEEKKNYHAWLDENPEHQKIADRILNKETYEIGINNSKRRAAYFRLLFHERKPDVFSPPSSG